MIRMLISFLGLFSIIFFGVLAISSLNKEQKWAFFKRGMFAAVVAAVTCTILTVIVFLF